MKRSLFYLSVLAAHNTKPAVIGPCVPMNFLERYPLRCPEPLWVDDARWFGRPVFVHPAVYADLAMPGGEATGGAHVRTPRTGVPLRR